MMSIRFKDLCSTLHLPVIYEQQANLRSLKAWCHEHVSQDTDFTGDENGQYAQYLSLAEHYLDHFLIHLPANLAERVSFFGDLNAVHYAAQQGYDRFISEQANLSEETINEEDDYKMTPLHKAASKGYEFTVRALLSKGANVHLNTLRNQLPIHTALFVPIRHDAKLLQRKEKIFLELLPLTPEALTVQDKDGNTLLHDLATHSFDKLTAIVIQHNPELAFISNNASRYPIHTAILNQQIKTMDLLLTLPGVAELRDSKGRLPLHYAARYGTPAMVQTCCKATADINSADGEERTALLWAACAGNEGAFNILMENGADAARTDYKGFSVLHFAVDEENESMVHWIVDHLGASLLSKVDDENKRPIFYAQKNNNIPIEAFLKQQSMRD